MRLIQYPSRERSEENFHFMLVISPQEAADILMCMKVSEEYCDADIDRTAFNALQDILSAEVLPEPSRLFDNKK